ncbi:MAG: WD40 repeat domain-containing protein, partial [Pseudonocardiaceae bacterium]
GHTGGVRAVAWSPDSTRLASAGYGGEVRVWDAATGTPQATLTGHTGGVNAVAWSPDGTRLASAGYGGEVRVWDAATGTPQATLTGHTLAVFAVAWSPDSTRLASAGYGGKICVFDLDHPGRLTYLRIEPLTCLQWTSAGIAVGGSRGVGVFDLACI